MSTTPEGKAHSQPAPHAHALKKPTVIGLYGIPGTGKTYLLNKLRQTLGEEQFAFFEGSGVIDSIVPGGLKTFKESSEDAQSNWSQQATLSIQAECAMSAKAGVVAGHAMFWEEGKDAGITVFSQADADTYTHIIYLDTPPEAVAEQSQQDKTRQRRDFSVDHLRKWQAGEKDYLRRVCREYHILFSVVDPKEPNKVQRLLKEFSTHNEAYNLSQAEKLLDQAVIDAGGSELETMLVFDADKTLAAADAGKIFWRAFDGKQGTLKELFSSPLGYSYTGFRQATLLYEEAANEHTFDKICALVAGRFTIHPEFVRLLQHCAGQRHIGVVVVTCGLRSVWEKVLARAGLSAVKVIGGGRISDGVVVTGTVKGAMISRLRDVHGLRVCAFGDSPLDLDMLKNADEAVVVVGEEHIRSKTMDEALGQAVDIHGLKARQVLLPSTVSPRLDNIKLPTLEFDDNFTQALTGHRLQLFHATDKSAAKLLMTPMRDNTVAGTALREAHRRVGWYLANEYLTMPSVIGTEEYEMDGVQGKTKGHRLREEVTTAIVALMRGGEPMAFGVNDAFPLAALYHAKETTDLEAKHLENKTTVVLVDSVVNEGTTVKKFVEHVRSLNPALRIVVVAGVVQKGVIDDQASPVQKLVGGGKISLVALRLSDNKFTGTGTTDTGNRLFKTTHLP